MEDILINAYLKYQRDCEENAHIDFSNLDKTVLVPLIISILATVSTLISAFVSPYSLWYWISGGVTAVSYGVFSYTTENVKIKRSYEEFVGYCQYCEDLKDWLAKFSVDSKEKIVILQERISIIVSELRKACETSIGRVEKMLQVFATPVTIAIITAVIAGNDAVDEKIIIAVAIIVIFGLVRIVSNGVAKIRNYEHRKEIEKLECFISDLQGVLDTQFEGGIAYKEETAKTDS
jgi:hypothetical protein